MAQLCRSLRLFSRPGADTAHRACPCPLAIQHQESILATASASGQGVCHAGGNVPPHAIPAGADRLAACHGGGKEAHPRRPPPQAPCAASASGRAGRAGSWRPRRSGPTSAASQTRGGPCAQRPAPRPGAAGRPPTPAGRASPPRGPSHRLRARASFWGQGQGLVLGGLVLTLACQAGGAGDRGMTAESCSRLRTGAELHAGLGQCQVGKHAGSSGGGTARAHGRWLTWAQCFSTDALSGARRRAIRRAQARYRRACARGQAQRGAHSHTRGTGSWSSSAPC